MSKKVRKVTMESQLNRLGRFGRSLALGWVALLLLVLSCAGTAAAAAPEQLWRSPQSEANGSGPSQFSSPGALAADPTTGHIFVTDIYNFRVNEFDAFGVFIKSFGWGVADGAPKLETCGPGVNPPTDSCLGGISGVGAGQLGGPGVGNPAEMRGGIAIDDAGNVYVGDLANFRVQKFSPSGEFLLMLGGEVNKTTGGDICTKTQVAGGNVCGAGVQGTGNGQFATDVFVNTTDYLAVGNEGSIFVGDVGRIQKFAQDGSFESSIPLPDELAAMRVAMMDIDATGNFYITTSPGGGSKVTPVVLKLSPAGTLVNTIQISDEPRFEELNAVASIALDDTDDLFVAVEFGAARERREVIEFNSAGEAIIALGEGFAQASGNFGQGGALINGIATNVVTADDAEDIYVSSFGQSRAFVTAYGDPPTKWPPPLAPPEISAQYAQSVSFDSATLGAEINPRFWVDTTYYVEYGLGLCSAGECSAKVPVPPGALLGAGVVSSSVKAKGIQIEGLSPGQTYHYRFVALSTGSGGEPVRGVGGKVGLDGAEASFITPSPVGATTSCPNQAFRIGASAKLANCRAYEMVSPVEKNNSDIVALINVNSDLVKNNQSSTSGDKLAYSTSQGFADSKGVPYISQYIASRGADGWQSHAITPPQGLSVFPVGKRLEAEFRAFTPDLCFGALVHATNSFLAPGAINGFENTFLRRNCGAESYETLSTVPPPPTVKNYEYEMDVQGLTPDGRCTVFHALRLGIYETCDGVPRQVNVRPNGEPAGEGMTGTANSGLTVRNSNHLSALSYDGSRVYWTENYVDIGPLYLRLNADKEQSAVAGGKCTEAAKACTVSIAAGSAHFWSASEDGGRAFFSISSNSELKEFTVAGRKVTPIASKFEGTMGAGVDSQRIFFVSRDASLVTDANAEGVAPVAGKLNLYLYDATQSGAERYRFVGTLSEADLPASSGPALSPINPAPYQHLSRVSPDGNHVAFMSTAPLTGYDNVDLATGERDAEVFVYDATAEGGKGKLRCVSCNPSLQRPRGRLLAYEGGFTKPRSAALLPPPALNLYAPRTISEDGSRVFFNSFEALVQSDTNGKVDVYQWEAPGQSAEGGGCTTSSTSFNEVNGGCISLISSGESPTDSEFVDASPDGRDVFFTTVASLLPQDPGLIDIYDARSGGGYPQPPPATPACEGEACQGPLSPPQDPTPTSLAFKGAGNVREGASGRCAKGKARRHRRCVAKKSKKRQSAKQRTASSKKGGSK